MPAYIATQGPLSHTIADFWQVSITPLCQPIGVPLGAANQMGHHGLAALPPGLSLSSDTRHALPADGVGAWLHRYRHAEPTG